MQIYRDIFLAKSVDFLNERYAQVSELKAILEKEMYFIDKNILQKLFLLMDPKGEGVITEDHYMAIMKSWSSFSATDINNDNELDTIELKTLIWLTDGVEPDDRRVQKDLKIIDDDQSGTIDRLEWIQYLSSPGGDGFNFELKALFDKYDGVDHSGTIELDEF